MTAQTLFALAATAAFPAVTAWRYARFALAPDAFDEAYSQALVMLLIAQIPLIILLAIFGAVAHVEGPAWRRVLIYVIAVVLFATVGGFAKLLWDADIGPTVAWAAAMQLVIIAVAGPQPEIARRRIDAIVWDSGNLLVVTPFVGIAAIVGAVALEPQLRRFAGWGDRGLEWSDAAWVGAAYFAMRTWSAIYVFTPAFDKRRKGFFQRAWLDKLTQPKSSGTSDGP